LGAGGKGQGFRVSEIRVKGSTFRIYGLKGVLS
jgi:hypothetical protein